ncbi:MAG: hypothetical protein SGARI_006369, partial [Bacillariaceae sp.]
MADPSDVEEAQQQHGSDGFSSSEKIPKEEENPEGWEPNPNPAAAEAEANPGSSSLLMAPPEESPAGDGARQPRLNSTILLAKREPMIAKMHDHFSLPTNSNLIRFRNKQNAARVYDEGLFQTVLEEEYDKTTDTSTVSVRQMKDLTSGTTILRISYSIV